jgi:hypothetical protein
VEEKHRQREGEGMRLNLLVEVQLPGGKPRAPATRQQATGAQEGWGRLNVGEIQVIW